MSHDFTDLAATLAFSPIVLPPQIDATRPSAEELEAAMTTPQAFAGRAASGNKFEIIFQGYRERGRAGALVEFAQQTLPTLQAHLTTAKLMSDNCTPSERGV